MGELDSLPFYYVDGEEMRMELIYESNKIIRPLDIKNDTLMHSKLPFALVSSSAPDSALKTSEVVIQQIGIYDNNWRKRESKRYNPGLVRYVSIIKTK